MEGRNNFEGKDLAGEISWADFLPFKEPAGVKEWTRIIPRPEAVVKQEMHELARNKPEGGAILKFVCGKKCLSKGQLFDEWARALRFPDYFGHNWDAFDEIISDFVVLDEGGIGSYWGGRAGEKGEIILILITSSENLLREEPIESLRILVNILRAAALGMYWLDETPVHTLAWMWVIFQCEPETSTTLIGRLREAGLNIPAS